MEQEIEKSCVFNLDIVWDKTEKGWNEQNQNKGGLINTNK